MATKPELTWEEYFRQMPKTSLDFKSSEISSSLPAERTIALTLRQNDIKEATKHVCKGK